MRIAVIGGAGFVGCFLAKNLKKFYPHYEIFVLDNLKRRGSELSVPILLQHGIKFIHGDIRNDEDFSLLPEVDLFIDAAAEPSVLAGINSSPKPVFTNNLLGTLNCLEYAKKMGAKFIFLSTSRVYPIMLLEQLSYIEEETRFSLSHQQSINGVSGLGINEDFPIQGYRSFYGASKYASECLIQEYHKFSNVPMLINRCGVIAGPGQFGKVDQGVAILWLAKHYWKKELSYIGFNGRGKQLRDFLHIEDLFRLIDFQIHNFSIFNGGTFNVGGGTGSSASLLELTSICEEITGNKIKIESDVVDRPADIPIYISDHRFVTDLCNWAPEKSIWDILQNAYLWINQNEKELKGILS